MIEDGRIYDYPIALRTVTSDGAMTADWGRLLYELIKKTSNRIVNEVCGVKRVVYAISWFRRFRSRESVLCCL